MSVLEAGQHGPGSSNRMENDMDTETQQTETKQPAPVLNGLLPYLQVDGAVKAAEFYTRAFGAKEVNRHPVDEQGRTMHIHLYVNGSSLMLPTTAAVAVFAVGMLVTAWRRTDAGPSSAPVG